MNKRVKDVLIIGFAVFAMFFGAGNMIFPPYIANNAGTNYLPVMLGFLMSGVGLPLIGIISCAKAGGNMDDLLSKVNIPFAKIMGICIILAIGPLYAIPRTSATTYEMMIQPIAPSIPIWVANLLFFLITYFLVINPSQVVNNVGAILTPALLIILTIIIISGFVNPIGVPIATANPSSAAKGFVEGYQTMDGMVSIIFTGIIIKELIAVGVTELKPQIKMTIIAGAISASLLAIIYLGLSHLGASASGVFTGLERTELLKKIVEVLLGNVGKIVLGLAVGLACLTTSIGLSASTADYFNELFNNKISYKLLILIICVIGFALSMLGVGGLIKVIGPFLDVMYPPIMVIILLNLLPRSFQKRGIYIFSVIGALVASLISTLTDLKVSALAPLNNMLTSLYLPLGEVKLVWITTTVIFGIIGALILLVTKNNYLNEDVYRVRK